MAPVGSVASNGSAALDTKLDAAFGILGASLVLSGLALATAGAAYKRLTCFVVTCYAMAIVTMALILHFGVENQVNPPRSGIRVAFVVASLAAGAVCGLGAAIFHRGAKIIIAPVAGFLFGLVLQSVRNDGLVRPIAPRYLLFLGLAGVAFILTLIPRYLEAILLVSTAFLGALALVLGIDCFTTAGMKEFFIVNLGFTALFPQLDGHFTISPVMQIELELGLVALIFCISIAVQIRFFNLFEKRLAKLFAKTEESEKRKTEEDEAAARIGNVINGDVEKFEHRYSRRFPFTIPSSLPTLPAQAHFDSKASTPSLPSNTGSFNTPISESTPILPRLNYVTMGAKKGASGHSDEMQGLKTSASNKSFFSQMKNFLQTAVEKQDDIPPVPALGAVDNENSGTILAKEIAEREDALEKIKIIRQSIDNMRTHLRTTSQSGLDSVSSAAPPASKSYARVESPVAKASIDARPPAHRHSVSFTEVQENVPRSTTFATFSAPRPLSQHSLIQTQQRAVPSAASSRMHSGTANQQNVSARPRPTSAYSIDRDVGRVEPSSGAGKQSRRHSTMTADTGQGSLTTGEVRYSQRVILAEPATRHSTGPQRLVTGTMTARSSLDQSSGRLQQTQSMVRTQTMDILELHAKHRRRLSEIQNKSTLITSGEPGSTTLPPSASQSVLKMAEPARKRSSTVTGPSLTQSSSLPTSLKELRIASDIPQYDAGRELSLATMKNGTSHSSTLPSKTTALPKDNSPPGIVGTSLDTAKDSEAAWLSY